MTRIVAIANLKGGVGKTTTAINLAAFLQAAGKDVVLVDLDPQANTTTALGVSFPLAAPLEKVLSDPTRWLDQCTEVHDRSVRLVPSRPGVDEICADLLGGGCIQALRDAMRSDNAIDYVLLDCPPTTGDLAAVGLRLADSVIIPVQAEPFAVHGLTQMLDLVERVSKEGSPIEVDGIVVTMFSSELDLSWKILREVQDRYPALFFRTVIPRDVSLAEATTFGKPICSHDSRSPGSWAYLSLTKEILYHEHKKTRKGARRPDPAGGPAAGSAGNQARGGRSRPAPGPTNDLREPGPTASGVQ
ncbi:MAG: ParA family protein [Planctomycetota bacterium]